MKKRLKQILVFIVFFLTISFYSCNNLIEEHVHSYSEDWTYDDNYHWHAATCEHSDQVVDKQFHLYHIRDEGEVIVAPTCTTKGSAKKYCVTCCAEKIVILNETEHLYNKGEITTPATCTAKGMKTYTCTTCNETKTEEIEIIAHDYKKLVCSMCGESPVTISSTTDVIKDSEKTDDLSLKIFEFSHSEVDGYNDYFIYYSLTNEIPGSEIVPGMFKVIYKTEDHYDYEFQTGISNYLYYEDRILKMYTFRLTTEKEFICLEYVPYSLFIDYIFSSEITDKLLNFLPEEKNEEE